MHHIMFNQVYLYLFILSEPFISMPARKLQSDGISTIYQKKDEYTSPDATSRPRTLQEANESRLTEWGDAVPQLLLA